MSLSKSLYEHVAAAFTGLWIQLASTKMPWPLTRQRSLSRVTTPQTARRFGGFAFPRPGVEFRRNCRTSP
jgi:hypothetical protein